MQRLLRTKWPALLLGVVSLTGAALFLNAELNQRNRAAASPRPQEDVQQPIVKFDNSGNLVRPTGYRKWIYVGAPLTPHDMNDGQAAFPEFHSVYIDPAAYDHYQQTGKFRDGTVIIKELVRVGSKKATSGHGYFMGEFTGLEVLMKDRQRFQDQPGHWGFFSFGHEYPLKPTAIIQPVANCNACHSTSADDDFVFTQYYPVLRAAKPRVQ
ncbi:MAG: cytochrome P460 family protein [Planctomycetaceae bacterium]|nr:cytochrome P460 family protein [Planctomycetaceae bacterium]